MFELRRALDWIEVGRLVGEPQVRVRAVTTDSRRLEPGDLFVALRGDRFDGHTFALEACRQGAAAVMVDHCPQGLVPPCLIVPDTRRALGQLAAGWRRQFDLPLIAVTGSNGKTTVKEMIASILACHFGPESMLATSGNLNNDIGVPMTLLRLEAGHRAAVLELGMNRPGEIELLAAMAAPNVALVNNAQREHQEFMHSVEATAIENGAVIAALPPDGVAVFPGDDEFASIWSAMASTRRKLRFGWGDTFEVHLVGEIQARRFVLDIEGDRVEMELAIDGVHNVRNAMAAAACARAIGVGTDAIVAGLERFRPVRGRLARLRAACGACLIDDTYNANPDSVLAAIEVLASMPAPRMLILGDMGEVGDEGPRFHQEIGARACASGIEHVLALGSATVNSVAAFDRPGAEHFEAIESLVARAEALLTAQHHVLVKGSRFMAMERVVAALVRPKASPERSVTADVA